MTSSLRNSIPAFIAALLDDLHHWFGPVYLVGSAVRNTYQGKPLSNDLNVLVTQPLDDCIKILHQHGHASATLGHRDYHTIVLPLKGSDRPKTIEIATFQHRPAQTPSVEEDLLHRDITVNAMAYAWPDGPLMDPFNGQGDLAMGRIRLVNGDETLQGDPLRALRLFRFALQLASTPDATDLARSMATSLGAILPGRIRVELDRILSFPLQSEPAQKLFFQLFDSPLGRAVLPELHYLKEIDDPNAVASTVWQRTLKTILAFHESPREDDLSLLDMRWASLLAGFVLHAKTVRRLMAQQEPKDNLCLCEKILTRFSMSKRRQRRILNTLGNIDLSFASNDRLLRRLLAEQVPLESVFQLSHLWQQPHGFICPSVQDGANSPELRKALERCRLLRLIRQDLTVQNLAITGGDILDIVRQDPGPWMGELQHWLLSWIAEDPSRNQASILRKKIEKWIVDQEKI